MGPRAISNIEVDAPNHFLGRGRDLSRGGRALAERKGGAAIMARHGRRDIEKERTHQLFEQEGFRTVSVVMMRSL